MNKQIGIVMLLLMTTFIGFGVVIPVLPAVVDAVHLAYCYPFIPQHRSLCPRCGDGSRTGSAAGPSSCSVRLVSAPASSFSDSQAAISSLCTYPVS